MIRTSENIREYWKNLNKYFKDKKQENGVAHAIEKMIVKIKINF